MTTEKMTVSRIRFRNHDDECWGVIVARGRNWLYIANFSHDLDLNGFSVLNRSQVKSISSAGSRSAFYAEVVAARGQRPSTPDFNANAEFRDLLVGVAGVVAIDYIGGSGKAEFAVGYLESWNEVNCLGLRYVSPTGKIESDLDWIPVDGIVRVEFGSRYLHGFASFFEAHGRAA